LFLAVSAWLAAMPARAQTPADTCANRADATATTLGAEAVTFRDFQTYLITVRGTSVRPGGGTEVSMGLFVPFAPLLLLEAGPTITVVHGNGALVFRGGIGVLVFIPEGYAGLSFTYRLAPAFGIRADYTHRWLSEAGGFENIVSFGGGFTFYPSALPAPRDTSEPHSG